MENILQDYVAGLTTIPAVSKSQGELLHTGKDDRSFDILVNALLWIFFFTGLVARDLDLASSKVLSWDLGREASVHVGQLERGSPVTLSASLSIITPSTWSSREALRVDRFSEELLIGGVVVV